VTSPASPLDDLRRLGLAPGATPDSLKPAWRRAVSQLHPDRHGEQADRELADVNAAFQRLQAFLREHGRLPGSLDQNRPSPAPVRSAGHRWALGALGIAVAAVVLWPQAETTGIEPSLTAPTRAAEPSTPTAPAPDPGDPAAPIGRRAERIELGLSAADVERLAGPPMFRSRERWEYGPSEIRFTDGLVSGWYSSPLRPLPVADIETFPAAGAD
jgi:hypothetical protein